MIMYIFTTVYSRSKQIAVVCLLFTSSLLAAQPTDDPNLINVTTLEQLNAIRYDLDGDGAADETEDETAYQTAFGTPTCPDGCDGYELMADLDFTDSDWAEDGSVSGGWLPIGDYSKRSDDSRRQFNAVFEGNGLHISNLYVNRPVFLYAGLFGAMAKDAEVRNLGMEGGSVTSTSTSSASATGGLAGLNFGTIRACYATGAVTGGEDAGGLVGESHEGLIVACYATGAVVSNGSTGGLVGNINNKGTIRACYATGTATSESIGGGLVGFLGSTGTIIEACYATGTATATDVAAGGLVGLSNGGTINGCYATGNATSNSGSAGGLRGAGSGAITASYFDSGDEDDGTLGKSTANLQSPAGYTGIYANWNVNVDGEDGADNPWDFGENDEYPALRVDFDGDGFASAYEFGIQSRPVSFPNTLNTSLIDVGTFDQLNAIRYDLDGDGEADDDANATAYADAFGTPSCPDDCAGYELITDLDLQPHLAGASPPQTFTPIGGVFDATFNGNGFTISNLIIERDGLYVGLVSRLGAGGVVRNLGLENVDVTNVRNDKTARVGGLVGRSVSSGLIIGCYVTGRVTGRGRAAGLVGENNGTIAASYSHAEVVGNDAVQDARLSGLVGWNNEGTVQACYATGNVVSNSTKEFDRGGLVGFNADGSFIAACYSTGEVTASGSGGKGGLLGRNSSSGTIINSYFDSVTSGLTAAIGNNEGTDINTSAQTTAELQSLTDYTDLYMNWNLNLDSSLDPGLDDGTVPGDPETDSPWDFGENANYPRLSIDFDLDGDTEVFGPQAEAVTNKTPTFDNAPYSLAQDENTAANTVLGTVAATDPENDAITYSLTNTGGDRFEINDATGAISNTEVIDYEMLSDTEQADGIIVTVQASDGTNNATTDVTITINDVNEAPTFDNAPYSFAQDENTAANTVLGTVTATDPDGTTPTYSLTNTGGDRFEINDATGAISNAEVIDYEMLSDAEQTDGITVTVQASDGTNNATTDVTIRINDVNEAPTFDNAPYSFAQDEHTAANTVLGTVTATDPENDAITYSLTNTGGDRFEINDATGAISNTEVIDYEMLSDAEQMDGITVTVQASDGTNNATTDVTIRITDVPEDTPANDPPAFDQPSYSFTQAENAEANTPLGTVTATDPDGTTPTYSLTNAGGDRFSINPATGEISNTEVIDYEMLSDTEQMDGITVTVQASDGMNNATTDVTIRITDVPEDTPANDPPAFDQPSYNFTQAENTEANTPLGTVTATDPDGTTPTYSLTNAGGDRFSINPATGEISNTEVIDYEMLSDTEQMDGITVTVQASDGMNNATTDVTIRITDVPEDTPANDPPAFDQPSYSFTQAENADANTPLGTVTATDPDGTTPTYSLTNAGGDRFSINPATGEISNTEVIDYEMLSDTEQMDGITVTVQASDGMNTPAMEVTIRITDVDEGSDPLSVLGVEDVRVYPNPASGSVRLSGLSAARTYLYRLYSLAGQQVAKGSLRGGAAAMDVSGLARGQYMLVLKDEEDSEVLRARLAMK